MNIYDPEILSYIKTIGYPTMIFLMIVEGPIATILGAFASSLGFFNAFLVLALSIFGDIFGDLMLYSLGLYGGMKTLHKAQAILKIKPSTLEKIEKLFSKHGKKIVIAIKSTTGLCWITFIAAGAFKMKFKDFLISSIVGGIVWSSLLVAIGYFFGYSFKKINNWLAYAQYAALIVFAAFILFYSLMSWYKKRQSKQIFKKGALD